jgi:hypothetical protein
MCSSPYNVIKLILKKKRKQIYNKWMSIFLSRFTGGNKKWSLTRYGILKMDYKELNISCSKCDKGI